MVSLNLKVADNRSNVFIEKDGNGVLLGLSGNRCIIISMTHKTSWGTPFIPYVYKGDTLAQAKEIYLRLVGTLVLDSADSKYFGDPRLDEHCRNGNPQDDSLNTWEDFAQYILSDYETAEKLDMFECAKDRLPGPGVVEIFCDQQIRDLVDSLDFANLFLLLDQCDLSTVRRIYAVYYGDDAVNRPTRDCVVSAFRRTKLHAQSK